MTNGNPEHDILYDRRRAARYLGYKPNTLAVWDCTGRYDLKPIRIGRSIRYRLSELKRFADSRLISTKHTEQTVEKIKIVLSKNPLQMETHHGHL